MKKCFKCGIEKSLNDFYPHKFTADKHLNKCKDCAKKDSKENSVVKSKDKEWVLSEKKRHRDKYYRLGYKEKHKPTKDQKNEIMLRYKEKYPEKYLAKIMSQRIEKLSEERHHWSYNEDHFKDVIHLTSKDHSKIHRYLIYDQERKMYRRCDIMVLLDTKEKHLIYINQVIELES